MNLQNKFGFFFFKLEIYVKSEGGAISKSILQTISGIKENMPQIKRKMLKIFNLVFAFKYLSIFSI